MTQSLSQIKNYLPLSETLVTAGQPTGEQLAALGLAGFKTVINLALVDSPGALPDERERVEAMGLEYVHIPVNFQKPQEEDFRRFIEAMRAHEGEKVFVHCAANMRVSAFVFLFRTLLEGMSEDEARADLNRIWEPNEVWREFMTRAAASFRW